MGLQEAGQTLKRAKEQGRRGIVEEEGELEYNAKEINSEEWRKERTWKERQQQMRGKRHKGKGGRNHEKEKKAREE